MASSPVEASSTMDGVSPQPLQDLNVPPLQGSDTTTAAHDEVIGLQFTNGHIFYLHRSTLMKSSGYFARRFGGANVLPPSSDEVRDAMGRRVYFFERDCTMFQEHILPFILTRKPGRLPPFSGDRTLWRDLRKEAEHFDIHGLLAILYVTHLCPPNDKLGHGILYYIGTNKGTGSHWNSQAIEVVNARKEAHYMSPSKQAVSHAAGDSLDKVLVQYRPTTTAAIEAMNPDCAAIVGLCTVPQTNKSKNHCCWFSCGGSSNNNNDKKIPALIHFRTITVRLVAYSLHKDANGMQSWTVEGSFDGKDWKVIHTASPGDTNLTTTFSQKEKDMIKSEMDMIKSDIMTVPGEPDPLQKVEIVLDQAENSHRHVWMIANPSSSDFFRFFRIVVVGDDSHVLEEEDVDESQSSFMSKRAFRGLGLELFGEVHED